MTWEQGGYNFHAISKSALAVTRVLMGEPPDRVSSTQASHHAVETVAKVRTVQSKYWRSIYPKDPIGGIFGGERLHDIIRQWQAQHLYDKYKLTQLHIFRDNISKSFEQQVLATPNYETKKRLLIIFHDAPDLLGHYNGLSTQQKLHDTWLVDGAQSYIKWAVSHGFAVIDINVPQHITINDEDSPEYHDTDVEYASTMTDVARKEGEKLAQYLWENYVEPWDFVGGIFLMGAGTAFHALAKLVSENENVYPSLLGIIGFIATNPIRPISNPSSHWVSQWYRENSLVYVSH
ncbi:Histone deacetylase hda1, partial [Exophiala xenobiotica]